MISLIAPCGVSSWPWRRVPCLPSLSSCSSPAPVPRALAPGVKPRQPPLTPSMLAGVTRAGMTRRHRVGAALPAGPWAGRACEGQRRAPWTSSTTTTTSSSGSSSSSPCMRLARSTGARAGPWAGQGGERAPGPMWGRTGTRTSRAALGISIAGRQRGRVRAAVPFSISIQGWPSEWVGVHVLPCVLCLQCRPVS